MTSSLSSRRLEGAWGETPARVAQAEQELALALAWETAHSGSYWERAC